jgi:RNA polymerase sigma-70 factor (ECF subfamily)
MNAARRAELQEAMCRLANGDRAAFHSVFVLTWPLVRAFAVAVLRVPSDAEDAAQQTLLRVFERASEYDERRGDALSWVLAIVMNECRTLRRRGQRRREEPLDDPEPVARDATPEEHAVRRDLERAVRETLAELPSRDAEVILASLEAVERPAVEGTTFRKRLERARRRLRAKWSARHGIF